MSDASMVDRPFVKVTDVDGIVQIINTRQITRAVNGAPPEHEIASRHGNFSTFFSSDGKHVVLPESESEILIKKLLGATPETAGGAW